MGEILWEETGPKARLKATVARYEAAMREALNANGAPLGAWQDPRMVLLAAGNRTDRVHEILRAALSDQPAEEPSESKVEPYDHSIDYTKCTDEELDAMGFVEAGTLFTAIERVRKLARQLRVEASMLGMGEALPTYSHIEIRNRIADLLDAAILDAQITPEEGAKETKR